MGKEPTEARSDHWGVILAGGDGTRLRSLVRALVGDERLKQFCPVMGGETLLEQTRRRIALSVPPDQTLVVVTRAHERYYRPALTGLPPSLAVVQPDSRGTAPAFLYALLRLAAVAPAASVAIFPSDHYVSDDEAFMAHVDGAFAAVRRCPDRVVLLGVEPDRPEVGYGWIEPGARLLAISEGRAPTPLVVSAVRRFWEKPPAPVAAALQRQGSLWNCFVLVGRLPTLLASILSALPGLYHAFAALQPALGTPEEAAAVGRLYASLDPADFSRQVLAARPADLAVLAIRGVTWSDLGEPARVAETRRAVERTRWAAAGRSVDGRLVPSGSA